MTTETDTTTTTSTAVEAKSAPLPRTVSLRLSTIVCGVAVAVPVAAAITFGAMWWSAAHDLSRHEAVAADRRHAEQVATDYALGASTIDYKNLPAWTAKLKASTTTQLAAKFDASAPALRQLLTPLQWTSTATPVAATVMSESGGGYQVDVFLDVNSTSAQTPDGTRTTITYRVTVDRDSGWKVSDVGGLDGALPAR